MKQQVSRLSPHQNGKVFGVLNGVTSMIFILPFFLCSRRSAAAKAIGRRLGDAGEPLIYLVRLRQRRHRPLIYKWPCRCRRHRVRIEGAGRRVGASSPRFRRGPT